MSTGKEGHKDTHYARQLSLFLCSQMARSLLFDKNDSTYDLNQSLPPCKYTQPLLNVVFIITTWWKLHVEKWNWTAFKNREWKRGSDSDIISAIGRLARGDTPGDDILVLVVFPLHMSIQFPENIVHSRTPAGWPPKVKRHLHVPLSLGPEYISL